MHLYLTGFMGVGKTTLGNKLAKALHIPFIDTDKLVEEYAGMPVAQIFEKEGEPSFRKIEAKVLRNIKNSPYSVIATGGGLPCFYDNMAFMNEHGCTIYLVAEPAFIYSRLVKAKKPRPLIKTLNKDELLAFIEQQLMAREPYYKMCKTEINIPERSLETLINAAVLAYSKG